MSISATALQLQLQSTLDDFFGKRMIDVVLDPDLIAKAAAGATRIRLRHGAAFSDYDRHQLVQHEALVHSLTALNGREQPHLQSMALSSPRTTATQEGLATFAEQITGAIDIERMKRISLRIEAVAMAMEGADFLEVFHYFRGNGQSDVDSFTSAQRVFRGVPTTGGYAFTKDTVYLRGLISVHTFFRWALRHRKLLLCRRLFAGKMTLGDVQRLEPLFNSGVVVPPRWLPQWVVRANGLAGMLAFSLFANRIPLDAVAQWRRLPRCLERSCPLLAARRRNRFHATAGQDPPTCVPSRRCRCATRYRQLSQSRARIGGLTSHCDLSPDVPARPRLQTSRARLPQPGTQGQNQDQRDQAHGHPA